MVVAIAAIRYEAEVDPSKVVICHCTDCQTLSGSAFPTVVPNYEGSFRLLSGTPRIYIKTAESGGRRVALSAARPSTPPPATAISRSLACASARSLSERSWSRAINTGFARRGRGSSRWCGWRNGKNSQTSTPRAVSLSA